MYGGRRRRSTYCPYTARNALPMYPGGPAVVNTRARRAVCEAMPAGARPACKGAWRRPSRPLPYPSQNFCSQNFYWVRAVAGARRAPAVPPKGTERVTTGQGTAARRPPATFLADRLSAGREGQGWCVCVCVCVCACVCACVCVCVGARARACVMGEGAWARGWCWCGGGGEGGGFTPFRLPASDPLSTARERGARSRGGMPGRAATARCVRACANACVCVCDRRRGAGRGR